MSLRQCILYYFFYFVPNEQLAFMINIHTEWVHDTHIPDIMADQTGSVHVLYGCSNN